MAPTSTDFRISIAPVNISVAVLVGAAAVISSSLAAASIVGCWSGAAISCAANSNLSKPAASSRSPSTALESFASKSASGTSLLTVVAVGASSAMRLAAAGSTGSVTSDCECTSGKGPAIVSPCCCVCIIANRLAKSARVSASAPSFNPGVSPVRERFGPGPSASIVFICMPHSLVTTGADLSEKRTIPGGALQKRCQIARC